MKRIQIISHLFVILALSIGTLYFADRIRADAPFLTVLLLMVFAIGTGAYFTYFTLHFED